jgi:hypothetical protein
MQHGMHLVAGSRTRRRRIGIHLLCWLILPFFNFSSAEAGSLTVEDKAVVGGPIEKPDYITGGQGDLLLTEGFYNSSFVPSPRKPIFAFAETDLQLGYMFPIIGNSFYRGNFEGLVDLFAWASTREQSGVLGGGALGVHYNFIQPGWRLVPYLGLSLGMSGNNLYENQNQRIIGGPLPLFCKQKRALAYSFTRIGA